MDEVLDAVENSPTGGRDTTVDSPLADGLPCHTSVGVDVLHGGGRAGSGMSEADVVEEFPSLAASTQSNRKIQLITFELLFWFYQEVFY